MYSFVEQLHLAFHVRQETLKAELVYHILNAVDIISSQASAVRNSRFTQNTLRHFAFFPRVPVRHSVAQWITQHLI